MKVFYNVDNMKVRKMCINDDLYTKGTNEEYENLLFNLCEKQNCKLNDLKKIAIDILNHSDWEKKAREYGGYSFEEMVANTVANLINECCYTLVEL